MKKVESFLFILLVCLMFSCEIDEDRNSLVINGQRFRINYGIIEDTQTTDLDEYYRVYNLKFQSSQTDIPSHYLQFKIFSYNTKFLAEGIYTYKYDSLTAGNFSYCELGYDIDYDNLGVAVDGKIIDDIESIVEGTINISNDDHFDFDLTFDEGGQIYTVTGEFDGYLNEGYTSVPELKK